MEREHDLVLEGEWDAAFITLVMAHSVFTAAEREGGVVRYRSVRHGGLSR